MTVPDAPGSRAEFRAFVRAHHPDVGGDPETFRAGLAAFARTPAAAGLAADPGPAAPARGPADDDPRLDAPITATPAPALRRLGRAGRRFLRRHPPRRGSSRVH